MERSDENTLKGERLSAQELADYLQIPINAAYKGLRAGQIPARRVGRRFIIFRSAIDEWRKCGVNSSAA
jgi:excisionase family DNA binding protein